MTETLVKVENVSKKLCRSLKRSLWYGMQDLGNELLGQAHGGDGQLREDEFWAVNNVSFELKQGECLGLIGRNGAGKTTLLRMLNGLIKPDKGRIEVRGRVGALIALGAGFNPVLTGRENIYVNGSVLGLPTKKIDAKFEEIVDFADIGEFIDSPVQSYSAGMHVRLGFAVATALDPDVLLLDEVLAVGDAAFRAKCYNKIGKLQKSAAVIFVSHSMDQISRISSDVLVMAKGQPICLGTPQEGISIYEKENAGADGGGDAFISFAEPVKTGRIRLGSGTIRWNDPLQVHIEVECDGWIEAPIFYGVLYDAAGAVAASFVAEGGTSLRFRPGLNCATVRVENVPLASGSYRLGLAVNSPSSITQVLWSNKQAVLQVYSSPTGFSASRLAARVETDAPSTTPPDSPSIR